MTYLEQVKDKRLNNSQTVAAKAAAAREAANQKALVENLQSIKQATSSVAQRKPEKADPMTIRQQKLLETVREILDTDEQRLITENHQETIEAIGELKEALDSSVNAITTLDKNIDKSLAQVIAALKKLNMSPVINTPAPVVEITEKSIDFTPFQNMIRDALLHRPEIVVSTPEVIEADEVVVVPDRFDLSRYRAQDLRDSGDSLQYIGFINPEGCWYIIENNISNNSMRYVFGSKAYTKHFKNAASWEYRILSEAIDAAS